MNNGCNDQRGHVEEVVGWFARRYSQILRLWRAGNLFLEGAPPLVSYTYVCGVNGATPPRNLRRLRVLEDRSPSVFIYWVYSARRTVLEGAFPCEVC